MKKPDELVSTETAYLSHFKEHGDYEFYFYRGNSARKKSEPMSSLYVLPQPVEDVDKIGTIFNYNLKYLSKWAKVPFKIGLLIFPKKRLKVNC
jgi:hypothetical protein